jgi:hypothetical protein
MNRARQATHTADNESQGIANLHAQTAARFAKEDAARMELLNTIIRRRSICCYCSRRLSDKSLDMHPGVCGSAECLRKARVAILRARKKGKR